MERGSSKGGSSRKVETEQNAEGSKMIRRTLLNGSAWSTEKKYMRRYKGTFAVFFGIEHRLREGRDGGAVQKGSQGGMEICR